MKKILSILILLLIVFSIYSEGQIESAAERDQERKTNELLSEMNSQIGMPSITNFQERKLAKMIFELRDQADLVTYAYIVSMSGKLIYFGQCVGFGLPYSVQYTNPEKIANSYTQGGFAILPQADPNGLYMPEGLSATWLMMLDNETGQVKPVYVEPEIIVSPFKLHSNG